MLSVPIIILYEIKRLIMGKCDNNEELLKVMDTIIFAIDGGKLYYKAGEKVTVYQYLSGILSGWQWTAFFDTVANIAENLIARDIVKEKLGECDILLFNAQGDDDLIRTKDIPTALGIAQAMRDMGFDIHKYKSFVSAKHNEYLRKYSKDGMINGYPARMVNTMLWVYPGDLPPSGMIEKLSSTVGKWKKFAERLIIPVKSVVKYILRDLRQAKVDTKSAMAYLTTEKVYGGAGILPGASYSFEKIPSEKHFPRLLDDVGYQEFRLRFGKYQSRELEQWYYKSINLRNTNAEPDAVEIKPVEIVRPLKFTMIRGRTLPPKPRPKHIPQNVIFGKSKEFVGYVFPNVDTFSEQIRADRKSVV